jgi:hypothetical protein
MRQEYQRQTQELQRQLDQSRVQGLLDQRLIQRRPVGPCATFRATCN